MKEINYGSEIFFMFSQEFLLLNFKEDKTKRNKYILDNYNNNYNYNYL